MGIESATTLVASVTAKVRNTLPNAGSRWTDSFIRSMIHVADLILREQAEIDWGTTDITLTQDGIYFALPTGCIWVGAVVYSNDGTNFDDGVLWPVTINELDVLDPTWPDTSGTKPTHYFMLSTPGMDSTRIAIYPKMSAVTGEKIRVSYLRAYVDNSLAIDSLTVPNFLEDSFYVPMVLSLLNGSLNPDAALHYWEKAQGGLAVIRARYGSRTDDVFHMDRPASPAGGQLA